MGFFKSKYWTRAAAIGIIGVILLIMGISDLISAQTFRSDMLKNIENEENIIDYMQPADYKLKDNLCGNIYDLLGCYCTETTTNTTYGVETSSHISGSYYLMPIYPETGDDVYYITVVARTKDFTAQCDQLLDDLDEYFSGNENVEFHDCIFCGKVKKLEDDAREYLIEAIKEIELFDDFSDATINKYILPYQLEEYNYESRLSSSKIIIPIGLVFIAIFVVIFIVINKRNSDINESHTDSGDPNLNTQNEFDPNRPVENMFNKTHTPEPEIGESKAEPEQPSEQEIIRHEVPQQPVQPITKQDEQTIEQEAEKEPQQAANQEAVRQEEPAQHSEQHRQIKLREVPKPAQPQSSTADGGMLSAEVSQDELDNLPEDGTVGAAFNYDDDGMGGIDVSALDLSSLDDFGSISEEEEESDENIYESDDEDYTFDSDPNSIQLAEMDR